MSCGDFYQWGPCGPRSAFTNSDLKDQLQCWIVQEDFTQLLKGRAGITKKSSATAGVGGGSVCLEGHCEYFLVGTNTRCG